MRVLYGIEPKLISLNDNFDIVPADYQNLDVSGVVVTNPNAPTGKAPFFGRHWIHLKANPDCGGVGRRGLRRFWRTKCFDLINQYPNLLVVQTLSKSRALAGIRVGYALGSSRLIEG